MEKSSFLASQLWIIGVLFLFVCWLVFYLIQNNLVFELISYIGLASMIFIIPYGFGVIIIDIYLKSKKINKWKVEW